jgi:putative membrane protein
MVIPQWLSPYLKESDLALVERAVFEAEKKTSAEIVPVVVRSSSSYFQTPVTMMLLGVILFLGLFEGFHFEDQWDASNKLLVFALMGFAVIILGFPWLAKSDTIKRWMSIRSTELEQVDKRAQLEFYQNCINETVDQVGVLIYISMLERSVVILTDKKIAAHYGPETWQKVVDGILLSIKQKKMGEGLKTAVAAIADLLTGPFPIKSDDQNELPNKLVIKE